MDFLLLLKLKLYILKNKVSALRNESIFKITVIGLFVIFYGAGAFWIFLKGFDYIANSIGLGYFLIDRLFYVFFMLLFFMLIISQLIITYTTFYRNYEIEFFFSLPLSRSSIYTIKFLEGTFLSSWAFIFLCVPLFLAYGISRSLGIGFYLMGLILSLPFVFIATSLGTIFVVILIKYFPRKLTGVLGVCGSILLILGIIYYRFLRLEANWNSGDLGLIIDGMLRHTKISLFIGLPSYWLSSGFLAVLYGDWQETIFYFLVLLSTCLFTLCLCREIGKKLYYSTWQTLKSKHLISIYRPNMVSRFLNKWQMGTLFYRDLKLFLRDPTQWSQFAIFFGIIAVYILNLRRMNYDIESIFWKNFISFLNISTISLTLGTLCTRFIYPQWSIECKRMWITGLTPVSTTKLMLSKLSVNIALCTLITLALILASNIMLKVDPYMLWLSIGTILVLSITLPCLSLGLGAIFPNLKEDDMAHIVAGFGGTLTLVLNLCYIIVVLTLLVIPTHLYFSKKIITVHTFKTWIIISSSTVICISTIISIMSLWAGCKRLRKMEY